MELLNEPDLFPHLSPSVQVPRFVVQFLILFFYILDANSMPSGFNYEERESPRRLDWLGLAFV